MWHSFNKPSAVTILFSIKVDWTVGGSQLACLKSLLTVPTALHFIFYYKWHSFTAKSYNEIKHCRDCEPDRNGKRKRCNRVTWLLFADFGVDETRPEPGNRHRINPRMWMLINFPTEAIFYNNCVSSLKNKPWIRLFVPRVNELTDLLVWQRDLSTTVFECG